jgi:hypothetical protein
MDAGANLDAQAANGISYLVGAMDRSGGAVKGGVKAVAGGVIFDTTPGVQCLADCRVVMFDQFFPLMIAENRLVRRGADDVSEEDSRKHRICGEGVWSETDELLHGAAVRAVPGGCFGGVSGPGRPWDALDRSVRHQRGDMVCDSSGF